MEAELAIFNPKNLEGTVSRKNADATAPRAQGFCTNNACAAGEFAAGTLYEGDPREGLSRINSTVRAARIAR